MKLRSLVTIISFVKVQWENLFEVLKKKNLEGELLNLNFIKFINDWISYNLNKYDIKHIKNRNTNL